MTGGNGNTYDGRTIISEYWNRLRARLRRGTGEANATPQPLPGPQRSGTRISKTPKGSSKNEGKGWLGINRFSVGAEIGEWKRPRREAKIEERTLTKYQERWACYQHMAALGKTARVLPGLASRAPLTSTETISAFPGGQPPQPHPSETGRAVPGSAFEHHTSHQSVDSSQGRPASSPVVHPQRSDVRHSLRAEYIGLLIPLLMLLLVGWAANASRQYIDYEVLGYFVKGQLIGHPATCDTLPDDVAVRVQKCLDSVK